MGAATIIRDIPYAPHERGLLDFYIPKAIGPVPVLVFFHGGGLESGERQDEQVLYTLAEKYGIAVATAGYRLYPRARFPEFIEDAAAAVQRVMAYGKERQLFTRCFVGGESAGAYLAMMLFSDPRFLAAKGLHPWDMAGYLFDAGQPTTHFNVLRERGLDPRLVRIDEAAPLYFVDKDYAGSRKPMPRLLMLAADSDMPGRMEQNQLFLRTLSEFHYDMEKVEFHVLKGFSHCEYYGALDSGGEYLLMRLYADFILE